MLTTNETNEMTSMAPLVNRIERKALSDWQTALVVTAAALILLVNVL